MDGRPTIRFIAGTWLPDPFGTTIAAINVSCCSGTFWDQVCDIALDTVETLRWTEGRVAA